MEKECLRYIVNYHRKKSNHHVENVASHHRVAANPQSGSVPCRSQATICGWRVRGGEIGPKSDSWQDWLISIFAGSRAVIQRADGKLCNKDGGDWKGRKWERIFRERSWERQRDLFRYIVRVFCFRPRPQQDCCLFCVSIMPSARVSD